MPYIQIKSLYNYFLFVLFPIYSYSAAIDRAGTLSPVATIIYKETIHFNSISNASKECFGVIVGRDELKQGTINTSFNKDKTGFHLAEVFSKTGCIL